jgi:hypothetical protein
MNIKEKSVEAVTTGEASTKGTIQPKKSWRTIIQSPLWLCLLCALAIRIWLVYHTHGIIDGDEAIVGIQAEHILRGEHPLYFYGQPYMGSLEAYLVALLFAIAGPSVWMLRGEPILLSLLVVWLTWKLAGALADAAQLSPFARQLFQTIAALLAAIPPLYDTVVELRALGGYVETFVLILLLFLAVFQLTRRWRAGASNKELAWRWAGIGFIIGFGFWINPLILTAVLAAIIWVVAFCIIEIARLSSRSTAIVRPLRFSFLKKLLLLFTAVPACIIGMAPAIRWGYIYHWANFTFVRQLGDYKALSPIIKANYHDRLSLVKGQIYLFQHYVAPRAIGGALPGENSFLATIHAMTFGLGLCCIVASCLLFLLSLCWHHPQLLRIRQLVALPLLYAICVSIAFCTSTTAATGLLSFQHDIAGRYAAPLMLVLPFFFAAIFTLAIMSIYKRMKGSAFSVEKQAGGPPRKVSIATNLRIALIAQLALFILPLAYFGAQVATYANTDADATFQSPSCPMAPAYNDPIIAYLQQEQVHYAWAIPWIGNAITFKTNEGIIVADPRVIIFHMGQGRIPAYTVAVSHADRPALLSLVQHNNTYPALLRILDAGKVTYHTRRFPSTQGYDVLVVTALSRTVPILPTKTYAAAFPVCI